MNRKSDGPIFILQTTANCLIGVIIIGPRCDKTCLWGFPTNRDSNQSPHLQKLARQLKFRSFHL